MSHFTGKPKKAMNNMRLQTVQEVLKFPVKPIPERGLVQETCEHFGIRSEYSEVEGVVVAHYFPVTKKGKLSGFLKRDLTKPKKYAFATVGDVDIDCDLVGQDKCSPSKKVFIAEGQYDYLSIWQALRFSEWNSSRASPYIPNVVTIGLGTKNAAAHVSTNMEFLQQYQEVITVFDNDEASPEEAKKGIVKGQDAVLEVGLLLPIKNVILELNDPNDYIQEGRQEDLNKTCLFNACDYQVESVETGGGDVDTLLEPIAKGIYIDAFPVLMRKLRGLRPGEFTLVLAPPKTGKAQTLSSKLLKNDGTWTTFGRVRIGDSLASTDGEPSTVTGIFPQGKKDIYKVTFSDGASTVTCSEHLWEVYHKDWHREKTRARMPYPTGNRVLCTNDINEKLELSTFKNRLSIPLISGEFGESRDYFIPPYMLGVIIGDGGITEQVNFTTEDKDIVDYIEMNVNANGCYLSQHGITYRVASNKKGHGCNPYLNELKELDLMGKKSDKKFIPKEYLLGDLDQRLQLLRGLMDTDGTAEKNNSISYCTVSKQLAEDFVYLVRSVGGVASVTKKERGYKGRNGTYIKCKDAYNIVVRHKSPESLFMLERKQERVDLNSRKKQPRRNFVSVEWIGEQETVCISVSHPNNLYVTDDFIVTHNTTLCKMINYHLLLHKQPTLGIYLEEDIKKTRQSMIAIDNNIHLPLFRENPALLTREQVQKTIDTILDPRYAKFTVDKKGHIGPERLMQILEWEAARGTKYAILDHLSFVFSGSKEQNERKEIDNLLTNIAAFVKKTGMHVIGVAHIKRDIGKPKPKNKDGSIKYPYWYEVEEGDARGSGAFEQVCWNLVGIDKEIKEDRSRGLSRLRVLLNREWDMLGVADLLTIDKHTGRMVTVDPEEYLDE